MAAEELTEGPFVCGPFSTSVEAVVGVTMRTALSDLSGVDHCNTWWTTNFGVLQRDAAQPGTAKQNSWRADRAAHMTF